MRNQDAFQEEECSCVDPAACCGDIVLQLFLEDILEGTGHPLANEETASILEESSMSLSTAKQTFVH